MNLAANLTTTFLPLVRFRDVPTKLWTNWTQQQISDLRKARGPQPREKVAYQSKAPNALSSKMTNNLKKLIVANRLQWKIAKNSHFYISFRRN